MKIALFTDGITPYVIGGIQRHSFYLCKFLAKNGVKVDLYHTQSESNTYDINKLEFFTEEEKKNISSFVSPFPEHIRLPGHYIRESYDYSCKVYDEFLKHSKGVDFVYSKNYTSWKYLEEKKKGETLPLIGVNLHGYELYQYLDLKDYYYAFFHSRPTVFNTEKADYVFSYGKGITELLLKNTKVDKEKIIEIPTGISESWLRNRSEINKNKYLKFVFIGRYTKRKGIHFITKYLAENKKASFTIDFIAPIPKNKQITDNRVTYHGGKTDMLEIKNIIDRADVLLCPSYSEGMPNVIMEGMARGCAILATNVGAVSDMVSNENGWLIKAADYKEFKKAMEHIITCPEDELLSKRKKSNEIVRQKFLWNKICDSIISHIEKIIE